MDRLGRVVQVEKGEVTVRFERIAACRGCGACGRDFKPFTLIMKGTAVMGDVARVQMPEDQKAKTPWYNYPLFGLGMVVGLVLANWLGHGRETWMLLGAMLGILLAFLAVKGLQSRIKPKTQTKAILLRLNHPEDIKEINDPGVCPKEKSWAAMGK